ncbi:MAG: hypothetical protein JW731_09895 [Bacteroidales bacterium]|nr:hypothetical protein [Bacteroidales bacterium]
MVKPCNLILKATIAMIIVLMNSYYIYPQNTLVSDTLIQPPDSIMQYITPLEYAFMMHEETNWIIKANALVNTQFGNLLNYKLGLEQRLTPSFTLNISLAGSVAWISEKLYHSDYINAAMEARWYYRLKQRRIQNKLAMSMSDNYIALGISDAHLMNKAVTENVIIPQYHDYLNFYLKWGFQRRFLKSGHADFGISAGVIKPMAKNSNYSLSLSTYVDLGFALARDKYNLKQEFICPVMKCYENRNYVLKSNLSHLVTIVIDEWISGFGLDPNISFEHKINQSSFSVNSELSAQFSFSRFKLTENSAYLSDSAVRTGYRTDNEKNYSTDINIVFLAEGRWYYNLKSRMFKGKCGNSLSADYAAFGAVYQFTSDELYNRFGYNRPFIFLKAGWQRLFSEHLYYDIRLGAEYYFKDDKYKGEIKPLISIAVGFQL